FPFSRTSIWADITIVDNIVRTLSLMIEIAKKLKDVDKKELQSIIDNFNNRKNILLSLETIIRHVKKQKKVAFKIVKNQI
ncbi:unnamed protein product, partial [marine sediment metagenome]